MNSGAAFFAVVDRLGVPLRGQTRAAAALKSALRTASVQQLIDFQAAFDHVLARARTAELWGAAQLLAGPLHPHAADGFGAWLAMQGSFGFERLLRRTDSALADLLPVRGRRMLPLFEQILEIPAQIARRRFGMDLFAAVGSPRPPAPPLFHSPDMEPEELWPHPQALEARLPQLWFQCVVRKPRLRAFPLLEDATSICACCGRIHAYAFGLLSEGSEPVGSYTLHWTEGEWQRLQSVIYLTAEQVFFAIEHHLDGSQSGSSLLDPEESPVKPELGTLLNRHDAARHPQFPLVAELAQLTLDTDPIAQRFQWLWQRRQRLTPLLEERLASLPNRAEGDRRVAETEVSCQWPDELLALSAWQRRFRVHGDGDQLTLDGLRRFRRGLLPVPVRARADPYCYGVWVEQLDPATGSDAAELDQHARESRIKRGRRGILANDLLFFPECTLGLECRVEPDPLGDGRPRFQVDEASQGPLAREQRKGMPARRPRQLMALFDG